MQIYGYPLPHLPVKVYYQPISQTQRSLLSTWRSSWIPWLNVLVSMQLVAFPGKFFPTWLLIVFLFLWGFLIEKAVHEPDRTFTENQISTPLWLCPIRSQSVNMLACKALCILIKAPAMSVCLFNCTIGKTSSMIFCASVFALTRQP